MVFSQLPDLTAIEVGLRPEIAIETAMRRHGRIDQQGLQPVAFGEMGCIVSAEGAADQQWPPQLGDGLLELRNRLTGVMMQRRHLQRGGQAQATQRRRQLAGLLRQR
jgi:hypothetical protein